MPRPCVVASGFRPGRKHGHGCIVRGDQRRTGRLLDRGSAMTSSSTLRSFVSACGSAVAYALGFVAFHWVLLAAGVSVPHGWGWYVVAGLIAGGTAGLAGGELRAALGFIAAGALCGLSLWVGLIPAAVIVVFRAVRRAVMLSHCDPTAPRRRRLSE